MEDAVAYDHKIKQRGALSRIRWNCLTWSCLKDYITACNIKRSVLNA